MGSRLTGRDAASLRSAVCGARTGGAGTAVVAVRSWDRRSRWVIAEVLVVFDGLADQGDDVWVLDPVDLVAALGSDED